MAAHDLFFAPSSRRRFFLREPPRPRPELLFASRRLASTPHGRGKREPFTDHVSVATFFFFYSVVRAQLAHTQLPCATRGGTRDRVPAEKCTSLGHGPSSAAQGPRRIARGPSSSRAQSSQAKKGSMDARIAMQQVCRQRAKSGARRHLAARACGPGTVAPRRVARCEAVGPSANAASTSPDARSGRTQKGGRSRVGRRCKNKAKRTSLAVLAGTRTPDLDIAGIRLTES